MDQFGSQMRSFANPNGEPPAQRPSSQPRPSGKTPAKPATEAPAKQHHNGCADVKPRLTKEQHDILERHFQGQHKPSTTTKKGFAETLGVPIDKINNWFQNRRAKVKQDQKKVLNQMQMNLGVFPSHQLPIVNSHFPPPHPDQQPHPMTGEFYPINADISPTCMPVESVERPSALDLGPQYSIHQPYDTHLRMIPEANRSTSFNANDVMQSIIAAQAGASYMQHHPASLPPQQPAYSYDQSGLPNAFPNDLAFSMPATLTTEAEAATDLSNGYPDFSTFDYTPPTVLSGSADVQNSTGSVSSEPSPFSGTQSNSTTQSNDPNASSVTSIASMYSGWTAEQSAATEIVPTNNCEDQFDYNLPQASASEFWGPTEQGQTFSQADIYQHGNASAQAILSSPGQTEDRKLSTTQSDFDPPPPFADDAYSRRNSSTTNLANTIESIHIQSGNTPDGFKQPEAPSSIAARRHKRPIALSSNTMRSSSYTSGMPSPGGNGDHTLRRIRSSGIAAPGRIQKPNPGSAQRSPMALTFAEAAASPKFQRAFSTSTTPGVGQGGSLAPPTPLTPNGFPPTYWQGSAVIGNHRPMPEHSSPESLNVPWSVEPQPAGIYSTNGTSPPSTPLDANQINQARINNENLYRDTPPQSAPATQQSFPRNALMQPPQMRAGFHSTTDLTIAQPKPAHWRRPSLQEGGHVQLDNNQMHFADSFGDYQLSYDQQLRDINLDGIHHNVPFAPPVTMPEFLVHEYNPQGSGPGPLLRRITEPQPKSYIFANQGPGDFRT